jgi:hypothetical protein
MAPPDWIAGKQFERIRTAVRETVMRVGVLGQSKRRQIEHAPGLRDAVSPR